MKLQIKHQTQYAYSEPVNYALQKVRLRPLSSPVQTVTDWSIEIVGGTLEASYLDHYGNHVDLVSLDADTQALSVSVEGTVQTLNNTGILGPVYGRAPLWHFQQSSDLTTAGPALQQMTQDAKIGGDTLNDLHRLSAMIRAAAPYKIGVTDAKTTAEAALETGGGVCQDHAQIFITVARAAGIPARYVSGYLMINDRVDQDATHAWAEAHIDGLGWVGFDVSNGVSPDEKYVRLAIGRDAHDAAPIQGMRLGNSNESLIVTLQVQQ